MLPPQLRIEGVAQAIAEEVERHHGHKDKVPRRQDPGVLGEYLQVLRGGEHVAPAWHRLANAQTQKAEARLTKNVAGYREGSRHDRVRESARQDVAADDLQVA